MERIKRCAACRYCRVHTALKTSIVLLGASLVSLFMMLDNKF